MKFKKTHTKHMLFFWGLILSFSLSVAGKAGACSDPSMMEMSQGKAMECCMERCRMETTHEAAQKACESSRHDLSPKETLSSPQKTCAVSLLLSVSDFNPMPFFPSVQLEADERQRSVQFEPPPFLHASTVAIYTTIQSFLI